MQHYTSSLLFNLESWITVNNPALSGLSSHTKFWCMNHSGINSIICSGNHEYVQWVILRLAQKFVRAFAFHNLYK
jgi:hypothetical protein